MALTRYTPVYRRQMGYRYLLMHNFAEFPERKVQKLGKNQFLISISKMDIIVNVSNVIDN